MYINLCVSLSVMLTFEFALCAFKSHRSTKPASLLFALTVHPFFVNMCCVAVRVASSVCVCDCKSARCDADVRDVKCFHIPLIVDDGCVVHAAIVMRC